MNWVGLAGSLVFYAVCHSLFASNTIKKSIIENLFRSEQTYRLFFVAQSVFLLLPIGYFYLQLPTQLLWQPGIAENFIAALLGLWGLRVAQKSFQHYSLQKFLGLKTSVEDELHVSGLHQVVRHPLYFASFLVLWGWVLYAPTTKVVAITIWAVLYFFIGTYLEEKKLVARFGEAYSKYRSTTPMFFPQWSELRKTVMTVLLLLGVLSCGHPTKENLPSKITLSNSTDSLVVFHWNPTPQKVFVPADSQFVTHSTAEWKVYDLFSDTYKEAVWVWPEASGNPKKSYFNRNVKAFDEFQKNSSVYFDSLLSYPNAYLKATDSVNNRLTLLFGLNVGRYNQKDSLLSSLQQAWKLNQLAKLLSHWKQDSLSEALNKNRQQLLTHLTQLRSPDLFLYPTFGRLWLGAAHKTFRDSVSYKAVFNSNLLKNAPPVITDRLWFLYLREEITRKGPFDSTFQQEVKRNRFGSLAYYEAFQRLVSSYSHLTPGSSVTSFTWIEKDSTQVHFPPKDSLPALLFYQPNGSEIPEQWEELSDSLGIIPILYQKGSAPSLEAHFKFGIYPRVLLVDEQNILVNAFLFSNQTSE